MDRGNVGITAYRVYVEARQRGLTTAPDSPVAAPESRHGLLGVADRAVPRRLWCLVVLALVMCAATVIVAQSQNLPIRDPDDALGPSWIRLPLILLAAVLIDVVPRVLLRLRKRAGFVGTVQAVLAERWPQTQIRFTLIGLLSWYLTYSAFRNLKSAVPFVNDKIWDAQFRDLDRLIFLGNDPAALLHNVLGVGWAAAFMSGVYVLWIGLIPASLAWALTWTRNHAVAAWYVTALAFDWLLGVAAYYAFPTLGPIYSRAVDFTALPDSSTTLQETMLRDRFQVLGDPRATDTLQTIAAFPSLHVGMMVTICLLVHWNTKRLLPRLLAWTMLALTVLATLYLGWHFFVDVIGGVAVGGLAAWLGAVASGNGAPRLFGSADKTSEQPVAGDAAA